MRSWCNRGLLIVGLGLLGWAALPGDGQEDAAPARILARLGGAPVSLADVDARVEEDLERLRFKRLQAEAAYVHGVRQARTKALEEYLDEEVIPLAARAQGSSPEEVRAPLRSRADHEALWRAHGVELAAPLRDVLDHVLGPARGPGSAQVTIVEFADFECPHCAAVVAVLQEVQDRFQGRVKVLFRHYPLAAPGDNAFRASEIGVCAEVQGRFWNLYELFLAQQERLRGEGADVVAAELRLDKARLRECLASGRATKRVREDQEEGARAGVVGTPFIFVNGVIRGGNTSVEGLSRLIEEELARVSSGKL